MQALKLLATQKHYFEKVVELAFMSVAKHGGGEDGFSLPSAIVNFVLQKDGIRLAREMYNRYLCKSQATEHCFT